MKHKVLFFLFCFPLIAVAGQQDEPSQKQKNLSDKITELEKLLDPEEDPDRTTRFPWWQKLTILALGGAAAGYILYKKSKPKDLSSYASSRGLPQRSVSVVERVEAPEEVDRTPRIHSIREEFVSELINTSPSPPRVKFMTSGLKSEALRLFPNIFSREGFPRLTKIMERVIVNRRGSVYRTLKAFDDSSAILTPPLTTFGDITFRFSLDDYPSPISPIYLENFNLFVEMHRKRLEGQYEKFSAGCRAAFPKEELIRDAYKCDIKKCDYIGPFTFEVLYVCAEEYCSLYEIPEEIKGNLDAQKEFLTKRKDNLLDAAFRAGLIRNPKHFQFHATSLVEGSTFKVVYEEFPEFTELNNATKNKEIGNQDLTIADSEESHVIMTLIIAHKCPKLEDFYHSYKRYPPRARDTDDFIEKYRNALHLCARAYVQAIADTYFSGNFSDAKKAIATCIFAEPFLRDQDPEEIMSRYENFKATIEKIHHE